MAKLVLRDREWNDTGELLWINLGEYRLTVWPSSDGRWGWSFTPVLQVRRDLFNDGRCDTAALAIAAAEAALLEEIGKVVEIREGE